MRKAIIMGIRHGRSDAESPYLLFQIWKHLSSGETAIDTVW